jgi:hypothetical protein
MADLAVTPTTIIPKKVATGQLAAASAVLYTVPAGTAFKIGAIVMVNDTTTPVTATLHLCDNGAGEGPTNYLCVAINIPTDGMPVVLEFNGLYLNATDTIEGFASAADQVTYHISGAEESA